MQRIRLGNTDLRVSRLCFGTEPFAIKKGPEGRKSQGDRTPREGGEILRDALRMGVNFWDTSDDYGTHPHVAKGLSMVKRQDVVIADKTNARTFREGIEAIEFALDDLGTDYIDIMFLHNVPLKSVQRLDTAKRPFVSGNLQDRTGTLRAFSKSKESGNIRAVGLSTHSTAVLKQVLNMPEIDIVCTPLNNVGASIVDGSLDEHIIAIKQLKEAGKGVYVIKLLDAGRLRDDADTAIKYALRFHEYVDVWNIGMYGIEDVTQNLRLLQEVLGD
jgi:aryl-alcohol dehydrogenase-like predicted oxidoreductase